MSAKTNISKHEYYMARCLALARRARGKTSPNPMVGAIVVKGDKIVGKGWHGYAGGPHAEVEALADAGEAARGSTLYVTLEPCNHQGRTGPCSKAVIAAGIKRVVVAMPDPNSHVDGGGNDVLRSAGVSVELGVLQDDACRLNQAWLSSIGNSRSFLSISLDLQLCGAIQEEVVDPILGAMNLDVVTRRKLRNRQESDALLVDCQTLRSISYSSREFAIGISTPVVLVDPKLQWLQEVCASGRGDGPLDVGLLVSTNEPDRAQMRWLSEKGLGYLQAKGGDNCLDVARLREDLYKCGYVDVLCEFGAELSNYFLGSREVSRLLVYRHADHGKLGAKVQASNRLEVAESNLCLRHTQRLGNCCFSVYDVAKENVA
jgi:diaminohydroxyphosphoribosylaminopyrimidine deaminase/5-amino-6-(5-phosphoribosylamino)uracil reductase